MYDIYVSMFVHMSKCVWWEGIMCMWYMHSEVER